MRFIFFFFFFNDTATTEIYTLSLHDALPIYGVQPGAELRAWLVAVGAFPRAQHCLLERVVGVVERAEHPVTVELERPPLWLDQERERLLVHRLRDTTRPASWADRHTDLTKRRA